MHLGKTILIVAFVTAALFLAASPCVAQKKVLGAGEIVDLETRMTTTGRISTGKFRVFENKKTGVGRQIHLDFVILHANGTHPRPDPLFYFAGGPGQVVAGFAEHWRDHWARKNRDIVLINQRGTAGDNFLGFIQEEGRSSLQGFLDSLWIEDVVRRNRDRLRMSFDLRMYSTPMAMDDIYEFRQLMGYDKINIAGASYGTRACLVYVRRHSETVRTMTLAGCAPIELRNPLYHAEGSQRALDLLFDQVAGDDTCRQNFGDLKSKFKTILSRLEVKPVVVEVTNVSTGKTESVKMGRIPFASAVRTLLYYSDTRRGLPQLICEAFMGNYRPFVLSALRQNMGIRQSLALGMLLSVTTAEDIARIDPREIAAVTAKTFTGPNRVLSQMRAAKLWPRSDIPESYGSPIKSTVPALLLSGTMDPVTPPKWGEMIHKNFPNSVHIIVPQAHDIGGACVDHIRRQFLKMGTVKGLDTECVASMRLASIVIPTKKK